MRTSLTATRENIEATIAKLIAKETGATVEVTVSRSAYRGGDYFCVCGDVEQVEKTRSLLANITGYTLTASELEDEDPMFERFAFDFYSKVAN